MADLFLNQSWMMGLFIALGIVFCLCLWSYQKVNPFPQRAFLLGFLKFIVFATVVWVLLEPNKKIETPIKGYYRVLILSDDSKSMNEFSLNSKKAAQNALDLLSEQHTWLEKVKENFQIQHYKFGYEVQAQLDSQALKFDESKSDLAQSLQRCFELHNPEQIAAILVLSDGQIHRDFTPELKKICPPLFYVPLAEAPIEPDLSIVSAIANPSTYEDAPTKIHAELKATGLDSQTVFAKLYDPEGQQVWKEKIELKSQNHHLDFEIKPKFSGLQFYKLEVELVDSEISERTLKNNQWNIKVDQKTGPFKILYVSGRPNWEYKYIRRALEDDPMLELSALIRIAKGETKFEFRDKNLSSVNPLFKGLDKEKAEREADFDEPVFLRLNIENKDELSKGFPSSKASLFKYHALIIDDLESQFFTTDQLQLIKDFVQLRGGACLFLGGQETFSTGGYDQSTLKSMMPMYFESQQIADNQVTFELTREGSLNPWARIASELDKEKLLRKRMPIFNVNHAFTKAKPGASVIAKHKNTYTQKDNILFAVQDYGLGKSAILSIGDFWRWHMQPTVEEEMLKHWRQCLRFLISDTPHQNEFHIKKLDDFSYKLIANLKDEEFNAIEPANLKVLETTTDRQTNPLVLNPDPKDPNQLILERQKNNSQHFQYQVEFADDQNEGKVIKLKDEHYQQLEHIETQWNDSAQAWLTELAKQSDGKLIEAEKISNFHKLIPVKHLKEMEITYEPLWDKTYIWIPLVLLLCLEWGLRRKWGMS